MMLSPSSRPAEWNRTGCRALPLGTACCAFLPCPCAARSGSRAIFSRSQRVEDVACARDSARPMISTERDGPGLARSSAVIVGQQRTRADRGARDNGIACVQGAVLTCRAATAAALSLPAPMTVLRALRFGFAEVEVHLCDQQNHFEQVVDALTELREILQTMVSPPHPPARVRTRSAAGAHGLICCRLVDLVNRNDDRNACRLGMVDRLDGLRHDAVVGCYDQDRKCRSVRRVHAWR